MKFISLFSVVRAYNILIIALAQYLATVFILAPEKSTLFILFDFHLFLLVLASSLTIASGYIINNFYDSKKDLINRPNKSMLDRLVSQRTKLNVYFVLNFVVVILVSLISWRACAYFSAYIFMIWYYSHRIKKKPFIGNLSSAFLSILPFFAILLYYKNLYEVILGHAAFLFLLLLIREMIKDLENLKGDLANNYQTVPIVYGEKMSKRIISSLTIFSVIPVYVLIEIFDVGYMDIYFYSCFIVFIFFLQLLWKSKSREEYIRLHNILKFIILAGVFSIVLINPNVFLNVKKLIQIF